MKQRILTVSTLVVFALVCIGAFALFATGCSAFSTDAYAQAQETKAALIAQNADPATPEAVKEANTIAIEALSKVEPAMHSAASGDIGTAILTVGGLLPPPFGPLAGILGSIGWGIFERSRARSVVTAIEKAKEKPTEAGQALKTALQQNSATLDANLTSGAKSLIASVSGTNP